jgi:hypothetical protein
MTDVVGELGITADPDREALDQVVNGRSAVEFDSPILDSCRGRGRASVK